LRYPPEVKTLVAIALTAACAKEEAPPPPFTAADCGLFLTKARATLEDLAKSSGMTYTKAIEDNALRDCIADAAAGKPMLFPRCVLAAETETAMRACFPDARVLKP